MPIFFWESKGEKDKGHENMMWTVLVKCPLTFCKIIKLLVSYVLALSSFLERMVKVIF